MGARVVRRLGRLGAVALLTLAGVSGSVPAHADAGVGVVSHTACSPNAAGHCIHLEMVARVYPTLVGLVVVDYTCTVTAWPGAVSTRVDACAVNGNDAIPVPQTVPGPVIAQQGAAIVPNSGAYTACIAGSASFAESILGPAAMSASACDRVTTVITR